MHDDPILVLDTASPVVSVAIGCDGRIVAQRTLELRRSSEMLLQAVDEALDEAGVTRVELGAVAASRGPGSFTGLRIGLATAIGLHQALGLPATGLDGRRLLARAAAEAFSSGRMAADPEAADSAAVVAVDALRGEWSSQRFRLGPAPEALERAQLRSGDELLALDLPIVGFGTGALSTDSTRVLEPPPLAAAALAEARAATWDLATLVEPIYFRPPATTPPKRRGPTAATSGR